MSLIALSKHVASVSSYGLCVVLDIAVDIHFSTFGKLSAEREGEAGGIWALGHRG